MQSTDAGRIVVVTGANEGIGYHLLRGLLEEGYRVAGLDVNVGALEALQSENPASVRSVECDVAVDGDVEAAIERVLEEWGRIDVLVNNAAELNVGFFDEQTMADLRRTFEVNYFGYVRTIRAVLPHMRERGEGTIHNVSSGVAAVGNPGLTGYGSTKSAVESLGRSLRHELRHEDVACTIVQPRLARTRSAEVLGYPESRTVEPAYVGRRLAGRIEATRPVIYTDWVTRLGLTAVRWFPSLVRRGTERFLEEREADSTTRGE